MTHRTSILIAALLLILIGAMAQTRKSSPAKEFMREKLAHSSKVLEGITMEDYQLILAHSLRLSAMGQSADWKLFQNPEYLEHTASFRRFADTLAQAARERNLDQATVAYLGMTMSCVECHKFVRGRRVAAIERVPPFAPPGLRPQTGLKRQLSSWSFHSANDPNSTSIFIRRSTHQSFAETDPARVASIGEM